MESKRISMAVFMAAFMVFMIVASAENDKKLTVDVHLNGYIDCVNKCTQDCFGLPACLLVCPVKCAFSLADPMAEPKTSLRDKENNEASTVAAQVNSFADCNDKCLAKYGDQPYTTIGCSINCAASLADSTAATRNPLRKKENDKKSTVDVHLNGYIDCVNKCTQDCFGLPACLLVCPVKCAFSLADPMAATKTSLRKKGAAILYK